MTSHRTMAGADFAGAASCGNEVAMFAALLADIGATSERSGSPERFNDRLAEAFCRLTPLERAVVLRHDEVHGRLRPSGSYGIQLSRGAVAGGWNLEDAELVTSAVTDDGVDVLDLDDPDVMPGWARELGSGTLVCAPMSAAGRRFGIILGDRCGRRFELSESERHSIWLMGQMAALAASAQVATRDEERDREMADRLARGRAIHERVMQRLFAVKLVLSGDDALTSAERERCIAELHTAHAELREIVGRPFGAPPRHTRSGSLRADLAEIRRRHGSVRFRVDWPAELIVPPAVEGLAQWVLAEAIANIDKHARPSVIGVRLRHDDAFLLEVTNDGAARAPRRAGAGLRLAGLEAMRHGAVLEYGLVEPGVWRVRLVVPPEALA